MRYWAIFIICLSGLSQAEDSLTKKEYETLVFEGCMQSFAKKRAGEEIIHCHCINQYSVARIPESEFSAENKSSLPEAISRELKKNILEIKSCKEKLSTNPSTNDIRTILELGYAEGYQRNLINKGIATPTAALAANCAAKRIVSQISDKEIIQSRGKPSDSLYDTLIQKNKDKLIACENNAKARINQIQ